MKMLKKKKKMKTYKQKLLVRQNYFVGSYIKLFLISFLSSKTLKTS